MEPSAAASLADLATFLERLGRAKIHHTLATCRQGAVMVQITVPGERWEVEFFHDGPIEVEIFRVVGSIEDERSLERLFREFGD